MTRRLVAAISAALLAACGGASGGDADAVAEVGRPAPAYSATTLAGREVSLGDLEQKVVLLNVWATWCAPCRAEIPYLQELHGKHAAQGLEIIGVSVDARGTEESIEEFRKEFGMTYPIWRDPDERIQTLYRALGVPASYLIDRNGVLRWKHLGIIKPTDADFTRALETALQERTPG